MLCSENCNKFDKVCLNIEEKFKEQDLELSRVHKFKEDSSTKKEYKARIIAGIISFLKMYFLAGLCKIGVYQKLIYSNLLLGWFEEFKRFWVGELSNRPIDVIDFHFLRGSYRKKFQEVSHKDETNPEEFAEAWQKSGNIYQLFSAVWKYSKSIYSDFYSSLKYVPSRAHILEYGCGIAPMTERFIKFAPHKNLKFTLADIKQINFLYARWKFAKKDYVNFITLNPAISDNLPPGEKYDVIICSTVFEHLANPLEVVKIFYQRLKRGGILIFDYLKGEGEGLDTQKGAREREEVLNFIEENFKILKGKISLKESAGLTIAKKGK